MLKSINSTEPRAWYFLKLIIDKKNMVEKRFDDGTPLRRDKGLHYSEKGSHGKRSTFWRVAKRVEMPADLSWLIKRNMRRDPQDGRH